MIPLSMEKESLGRPAMVHSLMLTGSPMKPTREKEAIDPIPPSMHTLYQCLMAFWWCGGGEWVGLCGGVVVVVWLW